jgi:hypothetical protein
MEADLLSSIHGMATCAWFVFGDHDPVTNVNIAANIDSSGHNELNHENAHRKVQPDNQQTCRTKMDTEC